MTRHWFIAIPLFLWGTAYAGLVVFTFFIATGEHWASLVSQGRITAEYAVYISEIPGWVTLITVFAAATRFLGGVALLLQKAWAFPLYGISLGFVIVIMFRGFVLADVASVIRGSQVILEFAFLIISVFAVCYAYLQMKAGILR